MSKNLALALIKERRQRAITERDERLQKLRQDNKFVALEQTLEMLEWEYAKNLAYERPASDTQAKIASAKADIATYLKSQQLPLDSLEVKEYCAICHDSGTVGNKLCSCAENIYWELTIKAMPQLKEVPKSLNDINFGYYKEQKALYQKCASFVQSNFFEEQKSFLTIMGGTGVGKTYLALTALKQSLYMGKTIKILNSIALNKLFLEYHCAYFADKAAIWNTLIDSDIMLIDDLGVEQLLNNVTLPYFYEFMVERLGKQTIFTTNMDLRDIESKYGQRIFSRLCDKRSASILPITGTDLRFS